MCARSRGGGDEVPFFLSEIAVRPRVVMVSTYFFTDSSNNDRWWYPQQRVHASGFCKNVVYCCSFTNKGSRMGSTNPLSLEQHSIVSDRSVYAEHRRKAVFTALWFCSNTPVIVASWVYTNEITPSSVNSISSVMTSSAESDAAAGCCA